MAEQKRRTAGAEPISRHPLFPAIVALWFGALFGLGSILISPAVIESAVLAAGIDRIVPMAAPPLGTTTRILLALVGMGLGGVVGFLIARRIARPATAIEGRREAAEEDTGLRDEVATEATLGSDAVQTGRVAGRRRALALDTQGDLAIFGESAPVPGHEPASHEAHILKVSEFDMDGFDEAEPARSAFKPHFPATELDDTEEAALPAWLDTETAWHEPEWNAPEWDDAEAAAPRPSATGPFTPAGAQVFQQVFEARLEEDAAAAEAAPGFKLLPRLHSAEPDEPVLAEPASAEPASAEPVSDRSGVADDASDEAATHSVAADLPDAQAAASTIEPSPSRRIAEADLDDLSPVELLERLALAMAERREQARLALEAAAEAARAASAPVAARFTPLREVPPMLTPETPTFERLAPPPFAAPAPFATPVIDGAPDTQGTIASGNDDGADAPTGFAGEAFVPAALRPVSLDDHAGDEPVAGYVPPRHIGLAAVASAGVAPLPATPFPTSPFVEEEAEEDTALAQGYSSLLNLSRHGAPRQNFGRAIRFEHEDDADVPVADATEEHADAVPFARPATAPAPQPSSTAGEERLFDAPGGNQDAGQDATEQALRAALATLQRMSGAA